MYGAFLSRNDWSANASNCAIDSKFGGIVLCSNSSASLTSCSYSKLANCNFLVLISAVPLTAGGTIIDCT